MLHSYNKRIVRKTMQKQVARRQETREAVIYDVLPDQRVCRVKIQGVETLIIARYPENWRATPEYLKPGNPVIIQHTSGNRHRVDVVDHGYVLPTNIVAGTIPAGEDSVLTGMQIRPVSSSSMSVYVDDGSYRIGGDLYYLTAGITMGASSNLVMGDGVPMGTGSTVVTIDAASSTNYRIDLIVIGTDGVVDVVKGTEAASSPEMPSTPANHVVIGWVYLPPNTTAITSDLINSTYAEPAVSQLSSSILDDDLAYAELSTTITVTVQDQYGNDIIGTNWGIIATFLSGNGYLDGNDTTSTRYTGIDDNEVTFTYTRTNDGNDVSPMLNFVLLQDDGIFTADTLILRDELGDMML